MSATSLYCNIFGGILKKDATFSSKKITASDLQNVELYDTGINSGVGIRTAKGNSLICNLIPAGDLNRRHSRRCYVYRRLYLCRTDQLRNRSWCRRCKHKTCQNAT